MWRWFNISRDGNLERMGGTKMSELDMTKIREADTLDDEREIVLDTDKIYARKLLTVTQFFIDEELLT